MNKKAKHSKFKNSGILFELLARQITTDILAGKDNSFAKKLMFKYFNESTALGKEFQLYNFIINQKVKTLDKAERVISIVLQSRNKLNNKELNSQKYNLIKEIKEKFNAAEFNEFLKNKISNYKLYASIYKLFENYSVNSNEVYEIDELVTAKEYILESMIKKDKVIITEKSLYESQPPEIKLLAYKFLIDTFNTKYSNLLPEQKSLLREYITSISNTNKFSNYVNSEYKRIAKSLNEKVNLIKNAVSKIKVNEAISQLNSKKITGHVKENQLYPLLNAYKLNNKLLKLKSNDNE